ncbi:MAG TPA: ATP phosphoribosyltransferase [Anaerolineae bacterium]|nr:ATP phosphoribosyltransferase [Anaerolineae bacterium]HOQ97216.1 ATP phosphoribosyltransferase [Anaerolineae bacterium]HPL26442.1 ATP phosphoribosyltransferase [Anaerolineae bacterium]
MTSLCVAMPKGRLFDDAARFFAKLGCSGLAEFAAGRQLMHEEPEAGLRFILVKPSDVPVYVEYGAADLGIVGQDVLRELGRDVYEPLRLGFGRCRLVVAAPTALADDDWARRPTLRVATKYPRLARQHLLARGLSVEIVALAGSVELAPQAGLADLIVDLVESGRTLAANGLREVETVLASEACLIVNRASHKVHLARIAALIEQMGRAAGFAQRPL